MVKMNKSIVLYSINTPILFLVYNRLSHTKKVFEKIKISKPPRLYIASDGPKNIKEDKKKVEDVRNFITNNIDWKCEVKTLFRENNLGCKYACSEAIDWFFANEEKGIILEDDTLPNESFFKYCEDLLEKYRHDMRVWHIAGNNFHFGWKRDSDYSYYFGGIYGSIWGWATWRNRWKHYDINMKNYNKAVSKRYLENCYDGSSAVKEKLKDFELIKNGFDTWDIQWTYARWINNGLTIIPNLNLVSNIGFGEESTHTNFKLDARGDMKNFKMERPLIHPAFIIRDQISENKFYKDFVKMSLFSEIIRKIKKILFN